MPLREREKVQKMPRERAIVNENVNVKRNYAVLIDGDNIEPKYFDAIMTEIAKEGDIIIKRVYGDWTTTNMASWKEIVFNSPIRVFQQFRNGENATDNAIIMDAIELSILNKNIDAFCIVSSDSDYYGLALKLRENGKHVLGIGQENKLKKEKVWPRSCNEFVTIENILKEKYLEDKSENNTVPNNNKLDKALDMIKYGYANSKLDKGGWVSFSNLGLTIKTKYPDFDTRNYDCKNLLPLIEKFPNDYEIRFDDLFPPNPYCKAKKNK